MSGEQHVPTALEQRWYVNEAHHRAILDGAQRMIDRLGIEGTGDDVFHQDELLGALDLIIVLRLELAAQVRALPERETIARAIDPDAWARWDSTLFESMDWRESLEKADAVLALFGQEGQR